ncbi:IS200/IS605 family transposase [Edwardsiella ictaluri]
MPESIYVHWCCQYHIVWTPKYRFRILRNNVGKVVYKQLRISSEQPGIEVVELNVQIAHVHLLVKVPPRFSISHVIGYLKGKTALRLLSKCPYLRKNKLWGNHFWVRGYCVDTVYINEEMFRNHVKYQ